MSAKYCASAIIAVVWSSGYIYDIDEEQRH